MTSLTMKKVIVVGEHGYVSTTFQKYIREQKKDMTLTVISSRDHKWEQVDFHGYDAVFNASGLAHTNAKQGTEQDYMDVNGRLPGELARKAKREGVKIFVSISSNIVYGDFADIGTPFLISDKTEPKPTGIYGRSKILGEQTAFAEETDDFHVAVIRPPLIYGETAPGNFALLAKFALRTPIFPDIYNEQSMIYIDNLCELIYLIIENNDRGMFYPQEREYIHTCQLVHDIARAAGHSIWMTKLFNPLLKLGSPYLRFIQRSMGNMAYVKEISGHYDWKYIVVPYEESVRRIAEMYR